MAQQDTVAPVITLIGGDTILVGVNNFFQEPGIIITDNADTITNYDSSGSFYAAFPSGYANAFGTYTIDYTAADNSNNLGTATRYIKVVDTISPTVTLNGSHVICIEKGNSYNDPGFNITDNYHYKDENFVVILEGCLADPNHIGTFRYRYTVIDSFNNAGYSEWRYVIVKAQGDTSACGIAGLTL